MDWGLKEDILTGTIKISWLGWIVRMGSMALYIYGITFNNAGTIEASLRSIAALGAKRMFIVDNYSTDGSFKLLQKHRQVDVVQEKCTRGGGRGLALERAMNSTRNDDVIFYVDLDMVYKKAWVNHIKRLARTIGPDEISVFGMLSRVSLNKRLPWKNLNSGEDTERLARAVAGGATVVDIKLLDEIINSNVSDAYSNPYFDNEAVAGLEATSRERRYSSSGIHWAWRMFKRTYEEQRGGAYKTFDSFYAICRNKSSFNRLMFWMAYHTGNLLGTYSYSNKWSNFELIRRGKRD